MMPPSSPAEIELKPEPKEDAPSHSVADLAARDYQLLLPRFQAKIKELSNAQLKRVFNAFCEYPLENDKPRFSYPQEAELFMLACKIADCKFVMMRTVLESKKEELDAMLEESKKEEEVKDESVQG